MPVAKPQAVVDDVVEKTLNKLGVPTAAHQAMAPDWTKLTDIARELATVTVHLIRNEKAGFFSKTTTPVDAGTYYAVPIERLQQGTAEWIYSQAGGGEYIVEVIHPTDRRMGMLTRFKVNVPGEPRKAAPLAMQEAQTVASSQTQVRALASQLMSVNPTMTEQQALETAQKTVTENPFVAQLLVGQEDDMALNNNSGMGMVGQMFGMMMMKDLMQQNRADAAQQTKPVGEDPTVKALRDEIAEMRRDRERERAETKAEEARREMDRRMETMQRDFQSKMDAILAKLDKPAPAVDPTSAALGTIVPALTALSNGRAEDRAAAAENQLRMLTTLAETANKRDPALEAMLGHMLNTTRLAMEQQQLRLQEPVKNAEAMNSVFGMLGGMMQVMHTMVLQQMQAQQGNPFWDRVAAIADQLPQIIMGLANPEVEHGSIESAAADTVDERAATTRVKQMREADAAAQAALKLEEAPVEPSLPSPSEPLQEDAQAQGSAQSSEQHGEPAQEFAGSTASDAGESRELPDDPVERAKIVLDALGIENYPASLLEDPDAVHVLNLFFSEGAAPSVLGEKLARVLMALPENVTVSGEDLVHAVRDGFGWNPQRAGKFAAAFERALAAPQPAPQPAA